jgi:hypothetical protein
MTDTLAVAVAYSVPTLLRVTLAVYMYQDMLEPQHTGSKYRWQSVL